MGWEDPDPASAANKSQHAMKILITAILILAGIAFATPKAEACDSAAPVVVCRAPYRVRTCEIGRCAYCKTAYNQCGYAFHYTVTVITYRDFYSDGTAATYTRSYQS